VRRVALRSSQRKPIAENSASSASRCGPTARNRRDELVLGVADDGVAEVEQRVELPSTVLLREQDVLVVKVRVQERAAVVDDQRSCLLEQGREAVERGSSQPVLRLKRRCETDSFDGEGAPVDVQRVEPVRRDGVQRAQRLAELRGDALSIAVREGVARVAKGGSVEPLEHGVAPRVDRASRANARGARGQLAVHAFGRDQLGFELALPMWWGERYYRRKM
jgi:hypothetical protein